MKTFTPFIIFFTTATARPPEALTAELDENEGCFNIGPASQRFHLFVLSLTIHAAENLQQVIACVSESRFLMRAGF